MSDDQNYSFSTDIEKYITSDILFDIAEIQKPRSFFQLKNFVVGQHDTEEMRYYQTLIEIQNLYYTIREVGLQIKKTEIEIDRLRSTGDEIDEIDAQIKELGLEQTRMVSIGAFRELEDLVKIYNSFSKKYTREDIEKYQQDYWNKRINRQLVLESAAGSSGAYGHLESLRQMGLLEVNDHQIKVLDSTFENNQIEN